MVEEGNPESLSEQTRSPSRTLTSFDEAVARASNGESSVVSVESVDGSVGSLVDQLPPGLPVYSRVSCASACLAAAGGVAEELRIDSFTGGAVVIENAQWSDPTSLGRLQRLVRSGDTPVLLIVGHRPVEEVDAWGLDQLSSAARKHAALLEIELGGLAADVQPPDLDAKSLDLVIAASLLTYPLPVSVAASVLDTTDEEILAIGEMLATSGVLRQTREGFTRSALPVGVGDARTGHIAVKLADALEESGGAAGVIGSLRAYGGQPGPAYVALSAAAIAARSRKAAGEAFHLAESAITASADAGVGTPQEIGTLHLICAEFLRSAGRTKWAVSHLDQALDHLDGPERIDALRLAATTADDTQRPQTAESTVAIAEHEAVSAGDMVTYGSLLALRARALHRIGFAVEADAALAKALTLSENDTTGVRRLHALLNKAWIHFDRGEAGLAEVEFTRLRDHAQASEGSDSVADKEAWRARALFASGHPVEALQAIAVSEEISLREGVEAPLFLTQLALTEGNLAYGRPADAFAAAEEALDLVERQLPAWENMALSHRAAARLVLGENQSALDDIERALEVTPTGADGFRWRLRCRALRMEIAAANGTSWPAAEAEDLADQMLQARLYGWAAELLCAISEHGGREGAALEAMAIANHAGLPMVAARAAQAGGLWGEEAAVATILAVRAVGRNLPSDWTEAWSSLPHVSAALDAPEPEETPEAHAASVAMDEALRTAGLADVDTILSPAQRRSSGLVRQPRRRRGIWAVAAAIGIVAVAAGTAFGVTQLISTDDSTPEAAVPVTTTPGPVDSIPLTIEETQIPVANERGFLFGTAELRGDLGRSGFVDVSGPRTIDGYYWKVRTGGAVDATPVAFGQQLFVGSSEGTFYALDQSTGDEIWTLTPEGRISTAGALGQADVGEGRSPEMVVIADDAGVVRAHQAGISAAAPWSTQLDGRIRSSPIVANGQVVVATSEGFLYGLELIGGSVLWTYPADGVGIGAISADLAYRDGLVYMGTQDGMLHIVDITGDLVEEVCTYDARDPIVVNPIIVGGVVYVGTTAQNIWVLPEGECSGSVPGRLPLYVTETPIEVAPAIVGDIMYIPDGPYLYAKNLADNSDVWAPGDVDADSGISAAPVVTNDAVYFASEDGVVHAVDSMTGESLWTWITGLHVRGSPAVVEDAVFIVSGDGFVYAIGGE